MQQNLVKYIKEKVKHQGFQKYLRNTSWMFFGRFFTLGISFFVGIYIARYLGPANFGLLSYVVSFVGLFGFLASFGIDNIISREIIKNHDKKDELIGTGFYIKITGSLLAIISIFIISFFTTKDIFTLGLIWIFSLNFIPQAFNVIEIYFQSQVLSKKVVIAQLIANLISTILKIVCISLNKGIFWFTLIYILETCIYSAILIFSFRKFGNHIKKWKLNIKMAKMVLRESWPLMLSIVAIGIYMKIDQVMIKNMLGNEQSGIYAVAVKLSEIWYFIPVTIGTSLFPALIKAFDTNQILFESRIKKLYFLMFWLSFSIASFTTIFAHPIIKLLFGSAYIGATGTLQIYVWAGVSVSMSIALYYYLIANKLTNILLYSTLFGAFINVALNTLLIPRIGIVGAATATLISYTASILSIFIYNKTRKHGLFVLNSVINSN